MASLTSRPLLAASALLPKTIQNNLKVLEEHPKGPFLIGADNEGNATLTWVPTQSQNTKAPDDARLVIVGAIEKLEQQKGQTGVAKSFKDRAIALKIEFPRKNKDSSVAAGASSAEENAGAVNSVAHSGRLPGTPPRPSSASTSSNFAATATAIEGRFQPRFPSPEGTPPSVPTNQPEATRAASLSVSSANSPFAKAEYFLNAVATNVKQLYVDRADEQLLIGKEEENAQKGNPISYENASISVLRFIYIYSGRFSREEVAGAADQVAEAGMQLLEKSIGTFHHDVTPTEKTLDASFSAKLLKLFSQITRFARAIEPAAPSKKDFLSGPALLSLEKRILILVYWLICSHKILVIEELASKNAIDKYLHFFFGTPQVERTIRELTTDIERRFEKIQQEKPNPFSPSFVETPLKIRDLTKAFEISFGELENLKKMITDLRQGEVLTSIGFKHCYRKTYKLSMTLTSWMKETYGGVKYYDKFETPLRNKIENLEKEAMKGLPKQQQKKEESKTTDR